MRLARLRRPLLIYVVRGEPWNPLPNLGIGEIADDPRKSGAGCVCHFIQHHICQFMHRLMLFHILHPRNGLPRPRPCRRIAGTRLAEMIPYGSGAEARSCGHRRPRCRQYCRWRGRFLFFEGKKESRAMEQTRGGHPPLLECLAVVAALALQFASVITLLQEQAAR